MPGRSAPIPRLRVEPTAGWTNDGCRAASADRSSNSCLFPSASARRWSDRWRARSARARADFSGRRCPKPCIRCGVQRPGETLGRWAARSPRSSRCELSGRRLWVARRPKVSFHLADVDGWNVRDIRAAPVAASGGGVDPSARRASLFPAGLQTPWLCARMIPFRAGDLLRGHDRMMRVATVGADDRLRVIERKCLFPLPDGFTNSTVRTCYDVAPEGQAFIAMRTVPIPGSARPRPPSLFRAARPGPGARSSAGGRSGQ